jgi:mRNA interferase MazF
LVAASTFRLLIEPTITNGLKKPSQVMTDKTMTIRKEKIHQKIGTLNTTQKLALDEALKLWLDLI